MGFLTRTAGIGGGAMAGAMMAIASGTSSLWVVLSAMGVSSVLGGIIPLLGLSTGMGAVVGLLMGMSLGLDARVTWPTFALLGMALGCFRLLFLKYKERTSIAGNAQVHGPIEKLPVEGTKNSGGRHRYLAQATLFLFLGPLVGGLLGFILGGPAGVNSTIFRACVALGAAVGVVLFLGFVGSTISHSGHCEDRKKDGSH